MTDEEIPEPPESDPPNAEGERYSPYRASLERARRDEAKAPRMFSETLVFAGIICVLAALVFSWGTLGSILFDGKTPIGADHTLATALLSFAAGIALIAMGGRETR